MNSDVCDRITDNISKAIVGKKSIVELLLVALIAEGHVLLEDVPGVAKTLLAKCLAKSTGGSFNRVQFTPDLMPSDITGFNVYDQKAGLFNFHPGPVHANVLLADEINRTIPRTQSSLLECMQERQVTVDGKTHTLPKPFFVIATQNPIELEGTFPLPEAQLDRFLLKTRLGYPEREEEISILTHYQENDPFVELTGVASPEDIIQLQKERHKVRVADPVKAYITDIVRVTRDHAAIQFGASPRGTLGLMRAGQARALLQGRKYVLPDDIKPLVGPVLSHRLILQERDRLRGEDTHHIIDDIMTKVAVPTEMV